MIQIQKNIYCVSYNLQHAPISNCVASRSVTVKPVSNGHSQKDPKLVFKTNYCLIQVKSIAECSKESATRLDFIKLALVIKIFVFLFLSGDHTQV